MAVEKKVAEELSRLQQRSERDLQVIAVPGCQPLARHIHHRLCSATRTYAPAATAAELLLLTLRGVWVYSRVMMQAAQRNAKEVYERENLGLRESRDAARHDADRQGAALKQTQELHVELEVEYRRWLGCLRLTTAFSSCAPLVCCTDL